MKKTISLIMTLIMVFAFPSACFAFDNLKLGDSGDSVQDVQQKLADLGYFSEEVDGEFGESTEEAVLKFQADKKLDVTGIIGELTYNTLMEASSDTSVVDSEPSSDEGVSVSNTTVGTLLPTVDVLESDYELKIVDAGYSVSNGYLYYGVILHNDSADNAFQYPTVRIMARNADGSLIGTYEQTLTTVYPGSDYQWGGLGCSLDEEPAKVEFELSVSEYGTVSKTDLENPEFVPLEITGVSEKNDEILGKSYLGEVLNKNDFDIEGAGIVILFRNENGSLVGGDSTFTSTVKAGKSAPFELDVTSDIETGTYELYALDWL